MVIHAVGVAKSGPETDLTRDYLDRAAKTGKALGFRAVDLVEIPFRDGPQAVAKADAALAEAARAADCAVLLDERGEDWSSRELAAFLAARRDGGAQSCAFLIGAPDGHGPLARAEAGWVLRFGRATWPHLLARAMLAEQLYRAIGIGAGSPYHRD